MPLRIQRNAEVDVIAWRPGYRPNVNCSDPWLGWEDWEWTDCMEDRCFIESEKHLVDLYLTILVDVRRWTLAPRHRATIQYVVDGDDDFIDGHYTIEIA